MIKKQSVDDETMQTPNNGVNMSSRLQKLQTRSQKMYDNIDQVISKTINAINECEKEVMIDESNWNNCLLNLHTKMTQIKPLKTVRDEYNDFYKKLSGLGKIIQQIPVEQEPKLKVPNPFNSTNLKQIESSLSDHYLSQKNYEIAETIIPESQKRKLFQQCFVLRNQILEGKFDRAAEWVENNISSILSQSRIGYEIHKMKIIGLVKQSKADEAVAYLRKNLTQYAQQNGNQISKLMNFIITHSQKFWGNETDYANIYKNRYDSFLQVSLEQLAEKFTNLYLKTYKIYLSHPVSECHQVGLKYRQQFIDHLKFMPETNELPIHLPFSIKTENEKKYHSYFFCPINKQVFGSIDKNVVLNCGHMVSHQAISKITEGKDIRRKMKCPICQSDQIIQNSMKVQF